MIREVNLEAYLPPYMQAYKEPVATLEAENPEFKLAWEAVDRVLKNHFILTADEYGISRFEKLLNILPAPGEKLEARRMRVLSRWCYGIPYTIRTLAAKLSEILDGSHNFTIQHNFKTGYGMTLVVYVMDDSLVNELQYILSVMLPENITANIILESALAGSAYFGGAMEQADTIELRQR